MPSIIHNLAMLLRKADNSQVSAGVVLQPVAGGPAVQLLSDVLDAEGLLTVQEFPQRVRLEEVGLYFRPPSVSMELTESEAAPVLAFYQKQAEVTSPDFQPAPDPVPTSVSETGPIPPGSGT